MNQRILVVDDEEPIRDLLSDYFSKRDYEVRTAATAEETVRQIEEAKPNVVILDILLPDADGMELLGQIKEDNPDLPVIIMTGIGFDEDLLAEARDKGASGYVSKTLPLEQLLMEVHRTLKKHQKS